MKKELTGKVYLITSPTGRKYVGSTFTDIEERWYHYKFLQCKKQVKLYRSLVKHGSDNHTYEIIWEGSVEDMFRMERTLGEQHNVLDKKMGLTLKLPGYDEVPAMYSEETLQKMRESHLGKKHTPESLLKMRELNLGEKNPMYGKKLSDDHKQKMSIALTGRIVSDETKKKNSEVQKGEKGYWYGKKQSPETIAKRVAKISGENNSHFGIKRTDEEKEQISKALKEYYKTNTSPKLGTKLSEETRKKISEAVSGEKHPWFGKHLPESTKLKISEANTGRKATDKTKKKQSEARKGKYMDEESRTAIPIFQYDLNDVFIKRWASAIQIYRALGIDNSSISKCCRGLKKSAGKYIWKYF